MNKKRIRVTPGDIFEVILADDLKGYFQFIRKNPNVMGGDMIAVFNLKLGISDVPEVSGILASGVHSIFHTDVYSGHKYDKWHRIRKAPIVDEFRGLKMRWNPDAPIPHGKDEVQKSNNWHIILGSGEEVFIGEQSEEMKEMLFASIKNPNLIIKSIRAGRDVSIHPL